MIWLSSPPLINQSLFPPRTISCYRYFSFFIFFSPLFSVASYCLVSLLFSFSSVLWSLFLSVFGPFRRMFQFFFDYLVLLRLGFLVSRFLLLFLTRFVSLRFFVFNSFVFLPLQRSSRAAAEIQGFPPTASGKALASVTATGCTSSACPPSSWWARRTSPARKTTSGPQRSPAASVGPLAPPSAVFNIHEARCIMNGPITRDRFPDEALDLPHQQWEHLLVN